MGISLSVSLSGQDKKWNSSAPHLLDRFEKNLQPNILLEGGGFTTKPWTLSERMPFYNVPGVSITFFDVEGSQLTRTYGRTSTPNGRAITKHTLFQAASISKPVTALGALVLVEKGKLDLDKPVNGYLKSWKIPENEFTRKTPITLRHLLSHTSGLNVTGFDGYAKGKDIPTLTQILNGEAPANSDRVKSDTIAGAVFKYSGGAYTIIQQLIEDVSGQSFQDYMQDNVLNPIGMDNSSFDPTFANDSSRNVAMGHKGDGERVEGDWHKYPEQAAAGLWTTPSDLSKFASAICAAYKGLSHQLIQTKTAKDLLTAVVDNWGLGLILIEKEGTFWFTHGGSNFGYRCTLLANANDGYGVVIMTNGNQGAALYTEILRAISKVNDWPIFQSTAKQVVQLPPQDRKTFEGKYTHLPNPKYAIQVKDNGTNLELTQLWNEIQFPIYPETNSLFFEKQEAVPFEFKENEDSGELQLIVNGGWVLTKSD